MSVSIMPPLVSRRAEALPFKGRVWVGMGLMVRVDNPIPIPAFPLKGKETTIPLRLIK